jgi:hypothetical protein
MDRLSLLNTLMEVSAEKMNDKVFNRVRDFILILILMVIVLFGIASL